MTLEGESLQDLRLRDYRPRSRLRVPEHRVERPRFTAIDAHNHLGTWLTAGSAWPNLDELSAVMDATDVRAIVNLDGRWGDELEANLDRYDRAYPGRFATFCHLDWAEAGAPGFPDRLCASLERSAAAGAKGVKVWKDLGLHVRDELGELLLPDDPRLSEVWNAAGALGLPVTIHVADPVAFFDPLDETNERLEELLEHPDWWFGDRERFPTFERLVAALEAVVAAHPGTTFVGAHVGGVAEDLGWVGRMLATYPNFHIDIAARIAELGRQPRAARALIQRFPDRVLLGTDAFPPDRAIYAVHFRFLESADEHFAYSSDEIPPQGRWAISGLDLPNDVLRAVCAENAARLIPGLGVRHRPS
jgi:predicted TIM-barrel fold metal-dependent hydrolase